MDKRLVIFDLDGTLSDSAVGIINSVKHAYRKAGREIPCQAEIMSFVGPPLHRTFAEKWGVDKERASEAVAFFREYYMEQGIFENKPYPGVREMLTGLYESGSLLGIATAKPEVFARRIIERYGLTDFFSAIEGSSLDGGRADKCALILDVLKKTATPNDRTVMTGDRYTDFEGASGAGVCSVGVRWGYGSEAELSKADFRVDSPAEFLETFKKGVFV